MVIPPIYAGSDVTPLRWYAPSSLMIGETIWPLTSPLATKLTPPYAPIHIAAPPTFGIIMIIAVINNRGSSKGRFLGFIIFPFLILIKSPLPNGFMVPSLRRYPK